MQNLNCKDFIQFKANIQMTSKNNFTIKLEPLYINQCNEAAIQSYDSLLQINKDDVFALNQKGLALLSLRCNHEAIECFNSAMNLEINEQLYNNKGLALLLLEQYEEALSCFDKAIEINQDYQEAYLYKGIQNNQNQKEWLYKVRINQLKLFNRMKKQSIQIQKMRLLIDSKAYNYQLLENLKRQYRISIKQQNLTIKNQFYIIIKVFNFDKKRFSLIYFKRI